MSYKVRIEEGHKTIHLGKTIQFLKSFIFFDKLYFEQCTTNMKSEIMGVFFFIV